MERALSEIPAFPVLQPVRDKGGHKVGSNLCGFLFGYGIRRILFTGLKDVFQSAAIFRLDDRIGLLSAEFLSAWRSNG
jgi:hypothetical protein